MLPEGILADELILAHVYTRLDTLILYIEKMTLDLCCLVIRLIIRSCERGVLRRRSRIVVLLSGWRRLNLLRLIG